MNESTEGKPLRQLLDRATRLLEAGRYAEVITLADRALQDLLQPWLSVDEFVRLALRKAHAETLLRVDRKAVARVPVLHRPIALRWEALRRSGRVDEARQMREVCILLFPERASVWTTAGNQALDENHENRANHYFERCLALAPAWTAGLAGKAIVLERRKDFAGALVYRERVVQVERALASDDPPSLQRVIRLAAALGRLGRWAEAEPLFHHAAARGAFARLPAERPVLLRVFSRELYAPAVLAAMVAQAAPAESSDLSFALREAKVLGELYRALEASDHLGTGPRLSWLGACAWLAGDFPRAYTMLDAAEEHAPEDLFVQHLLAHSALAIRAPERENIVRFALEAATRVTDLTHGGALLPDVQRLGALATLARFKAPEAALTSLHALPSAQGELVSFLRDALAEEPSPLVPQPELDLPSGLLRVAAFRLASQAWGRSAVGAARGSHDALRALAGRA